MIVLCNVGDIKIIHIGTGCFYGLLSKLFEHFREGIEDDIGGKGVHILIIRAITQLFIQEQS